MQPLSPHYRTDDDHGLPESLRTYLDEHYFARLPNRDMPHPKLLVVFSGGNAMGKSTLSRKIGQDLGALVLENDAVKECILAHMPHIERQQLNTYTWQYTMDLYSRLGELTPNGFIVRDGIIDWYYDRILPIFEKAGYALFVVGFSLSEEKARELIIQRGDTPTTQVDRLLLLREDHQIHTTRFRTQYTPDILLTDETVFNHALVIDRLRAKLEQLS